MNTNMAMVPPLVLLGLAMGCGAADNSLPDTAPTTVQKIADVGMTNIGAVAASPEGKTFYALAYDEESQPGVFATTVATGEVSPLFVGAPLLYPSDIATSCDGSVVYVSDMGIAAPDSEFDDDLEDGMQHGGVHVIDTQSGERSDLLASAIGRAAGIALSTDCTTLYITGWTQAGAPALFTVDAGGGAVSVVAEGAPLISPTGVHVDKSSVAWVMDHMARTAEGAQGVLFAIDSGGAVSEVVGGLGMGRHGGVSLAPGGKTAVIPVLDDLSGEASLLTANTETMEVSVVPTPDIQHPTGVAAAKDAPVMVVAGEYGLHIATFE